MTEADARESLGDIYDHYEQPQGELRQTREEFIESHLRIIWKLAGKQWDESYARGYVEAWARSY